MTVRTRVAPSPTGSPHLGTAYIALFNKAFAEQQNGQFILRIEDSDAARSTSQSEQEILNCLRWLNLEWDEGPDVGGPSGPYRISERLDVYRKYAEELVELGGAFYCFCTPERLDTLRQEQRKRGETTRYDGLCTTLSRDEVQERIGNNEPYVIRLKVPDSGTCSFKDQIRGEVTIPWNQVDMQVLLKSDGMPTYHLAAPVDDHLMGITHVLRGEEWLNSCPKHVLLYEYLGWDYQELYHLPLLRNTDQSKMSKRKNPTGIKYYRDKGYLPEALLNYLATMGWSMPDESEHFSYAEFVTHLDLNRISPRGPVFDHEKLDWLNGRYLRDLTREQLIQRYWEWLSRGDQVEATTDMLSERIERFDQVFSQVDYLLGDRPLLNEESFVKLKLENEEITRVFDFTLRALSEVEIWTSESIQEAIRATANLMEIKFRDFLAPLFIAISGRSVALPLFDSMNVLGREICRDRIRSAIDQLGGLSNKKLKRLDKEWTQLKERGFVGDS